MNQLEKSINEGLENRHKMHHNATCNYKDIKPYDNIELIKLINQTIDSIEQQ